MHLPFTLALLYLSRCLSLLQYSKHMQYYNINLNKNNKKKNKNDGNRNFSKAFCLKIKIYFGERNLSLIFCHSDDKVIAIQSRGKSHHEQKLPKFPKKLLNKY